MRREKTDQILKGANPGDIPFYQPAKFEFVVNLKAAKEIGLALSEPLLARADEMIELWCLCCSAWVLVGPFEIFHRKLKTSVCW
jgi:hypothetical protein